MAGMCEAPDGTDSGGRYGNSDSIHYLLESEEELVFTPSRDDKYDCPICLFVLREPLQTKCGHRFCKRCIEKWLSESDPRCPVDNQRLSKGELFPDNYAKREILNLTVKCPNYKKGCDLVVTLSDVQNHYNACDFSYVPCPLHCANILLRRDLESHKLNECPKRIVQCSLCKNNIAAEDKESHSSQCPLSVVQCTSCSAQFPRQHSTVHMSECPKAKVKCQYTFLGCGFESERQQMADHEQQAMMFHMGLINRSLQLLFAMFRINPLSVQHSSITSIHRPSSLGFLPTERTASVESLASGSASYPLSSANVSEQSNLAMMQHLFQHLNVKDASEVRSDAQPSGMHSIVNVSRPVEMLRADSVIHSVQSTDGDGTTAKDRTDIEEISSTRTVEGPDLQYLGKPSSQQDNLATMSIMDDTQFQSFKSQNDLQDESLARHDHLLMELKQRNDYQEKVIKDMKVKVRELEKTVSEFEGRSGNGVYIWKIKNYRKLRQEAESGEVTAIHSSSFYSSVYGYKLCIRVNLNGVDSARGTHLSLFIHFMQGEFDDILDWPFNGRIILTVIDQNPICELRNHVSETLLSKPNLAAFQRPQNPRNHKGFGYMEFLPLSVIDKMAYIRNDTLIIKAQIITNSGPT